MSDNKREVRFAATAPIELRADEGDGGDVKVGGYAAIFGEETEIAPHASWGWREVIAEGAFSEALKRGDDVVFLINHEGLPLARTSSGTLTLSEDERGLKIETELDPEDPDVGRILPKMKRGDLSKMSFAFRATVEEWDESGDRPIRTIKEVELFDVAIVTEPAYEGTDIGLRSKEAAASSGGVKNSDRRRKMRLRLAVAD